MGRCFTGLPGGGTVLYRLTELTDGATGLLLMVLYRLTGLTDGATGPLPMVLYQLAGLVRGALPGRRTVGWYFTDAPSGGVVLR